MKTIVLSDHTADVIDQQQQQRADFNKSRLDAYSRQLAVLNAKKVETSRMLRGTWAAFGLSFRLIPYLWDWFAVRAGADPQPPVALKAQYTQQEAVWHAGNAGERNVHNFLAKQLDDRWTLLKGYHNPKGEIDMIVVGPLGVVAMEVKNRNGQVFVNGDVWTSNKFDNYGNIVERGKRWVDAGGRSPARQLNEPSDRLQEFFARCGFNRRILRHVVLAHPKGWVGSVNNMTVDWLGRMDKLNLQAWTSNDGVYLTAEQIALVVDLIQKDHMHHTVRRAQRMAVAQ